MARKVTLEEWMSAAAADSDKEGGLTQLILHHKVQGAERLGEIVHKISRGSSEWDLKKLSELFVLKARVFIQEKPGRQVFKVLAFWGGRGEPESGFEFSLEREEDGVGQLTEGADPKGVLSQRMRHDEALGALYINGLDRLLGHVLEHNRQLATEAQHLRHDNQQNFEVMKSMVLDSESRAHELKMKEMEFERTSVLYRKAMELGGPLLNTITGREIVPHSVADSQLIRALVLHMHAQQDGSSGGSAVHQLLAGLPAPVVASLMGRANEIIAEEKKAREEIRGMNPYADPAADASGEVSKSLANGGSH
jgi:hypothetical protein